MTRISISGKMSLLFVLCLFGAAQSVAAQNYAITQSTGATIVSGTVDIGNHCDDCTTSIVLPFPYTLYNTTYTNVIASSNGSLQFTGNNNNFDSDCLPDANYQAAILPYQDDLWTFNAGEGIFTSISGVAPNRIFNIEWRVTHFPGNDPGTAANFEVRLYEGQGRFDIIYGHTSDNGAGESVGVQESGTGPRSTEFSCRTASLSDGLMLVFILEPAADTFQVNYFAGANGARPDQTVRITNPGTASGETPPPPPPPPPPAVTYDLCANIYVFRNDQQLAECCSCKVTPNGLRTLSVDFDLANNPLTPGAIGEGVIKIVSSLAPVYGNGTTGCSPAVAASGYNPVPALRAWATHNQDVSGGLQGSAINQVTETHFLDAKLSDAELSELQTNCRFINEQGSGHGICTCGRGD